MELKTITLCAAVCSTTFSPFALSADGSLCVHESSNGLVITSAERCNDVSQRMTRLQFGDLLRARIAPIAYRNSPVDIPDSRSIVEKKIQKIERLNANGAVKPRPYYGQIYVE